VDSTVDPAEALIPLAMHAQEFGEIDFLEDHRRWSFWSVGSTAVRRNGADVVIGPPASART
jgi:hypothetical protein